MSNNSSRFSKGFSALGTQEAQPRFRRERDNRPQRPLPIFSHDYNQWTADGRDHINIDQYAETELGRKLNQYSNTPFVHPYLGKFACLKGFMTYLQYNGRQGADKLRSVHGNVLRKEVKAITTANGNDRTERKQFKHWRAIVAQALMLQIDQNPALKEMLISNTLSFDTYGVSRDTGLRSRSTYSHLTWYSSMVEKVCETLQANQVVNPMWWADDYSIEDAGQADEAYELLLESVVPAYQLKFLKEKFQAEEQARLEQEAKELAEQQQNDGVAQIEPDTEVSGCDVVEDCRTPEPEQQG